MSTTEDELTGLPRTAALEFAPNHNRLPGPAFSKTCAGHRVSRIGLKGPRWNMLDTGNGVSQIQPRSKTIKKQT